MNNKASDIKLVYIYSTIKDIFCACPLNDGFRGVTIDQRYTFLDWRLFGGMLSFHTLERSMVSIY